MLIRKNKLRNIVFSSWSSSFFLLFMSLMGIYRYWRCLSNRFEYIYIYIEHLCVEYSIWHLSIFGWEERERREKERTVVKFAYYYFLSFTMSFVRKWTFFFALRVRTYVYVYSVELREHRSNSIVLYIYIYICYFVLLSYLLHYIIVITMAIIKEEKRGNDLIVTSVGV